MALYRLLLPVLFVAAFPAWVVKMVRRGGFGSGLRERLSIYRCPLEQEPCGAVHLHAVSVGESLLALKLLREWRKSVPDQKFVLAVGTATGQAVAREHAPEGVRVVYAPLDFRWMVRRYLSRFEPSQIVLVEGEAWPNLMVLAQRRSIPVRLVNARMSPRSQRRYRKFAPWIRPVFSRFDRVGVQEPADAAIWQDLGLPADKIAVTGSLKFDPGTGARPEPRAEFTTMLEAFGPGRRIAMAASTHTGEESLIATAIREADPEALPVIVPRHAERRAEVKTALLAEGFEVVLRSVYSAPVDPARACLVIDSTGELRDWTAHADVVVIGKSFLGTGGQNPCEAVLAGKPVVFGPHMENFEPLASALVESGGCIRVVDTGALVTSIRACLRPDSTLREGIAAATGVLIRHEGATARTVDLLKA
ncbi:3-deoxy-D-manno-octulosonic acid transferase [Luteolibacter sp. LG18]|nr:3-deoxy-D-manno-octulosonic acid transferase [Luteolibacter sp. LG18]